MPRAIVKYPRTVGVRVTPADEAKLRFLCDQVQCSTGDLLRTLIRLATPTDVPRIVFTAPAKDIDNVEVLPHESKYA